MRIILEGNSEIEHGLAKVLSACGHKMVIWSPGAKPLFDLFYEFHPEVLIREHNSEIPGLDRCLRNYGTKTGIKLNLPAMDTFVHLSALPTDMFRRDLVCVAPEQSSWDYLRRLARGNCDFLILDGGPSIPETLGTCSSEAIAQAIASADMYLETIHMVTGRSLTAIYHGKTVVCPLLPDGVPEALKQKILPVSDPVAMEFVNRGTVEQGRLASDIVLRNHTYWNRAASLFYRLGDNREGDRILELRYEKIGLSRQ